MKLTISILALTAILVLPACKVRVRSGSGVNTSIKINVTTTSRVTDRGIWMIEYQADGDTLAFAVINEPVPGSDTTEGHLTYTASSDTTGLQAIGVRKPDGSGTLPVTHQLYQVTPHGILFTDSRVSAPTFQAFIESHPSDFSIASLLAYAARTPATAKQ